MLANLRARRLACRYWAGRVALRENSARQHRFADPRGSEAGAAEIKSLEIEPELWAGRRSVAAVLGVRFTRPRCRVVRGQHARGVLSFPPRASRGRGV